MPDNGSPTNKNLIFSGFKLTSLNALSVAWFTWVLFGVYFILFHLNAALVDTSGHIASAVSVSQGLYHHFNDGFFSGLIQGLFYPPLEDFILGSLFTILPFSPFSIYPLYLASLWLISNLILYRLCVQLSDKKLMPLVLGLSACFFFQAMSKPGLIPHQGLSLSDLWNTGLSSEQLGFCFFILLYGEAQKKTERLELSALWLSLCVLSHIVIGLVAALLWGCLLVTRPEKKKRASLTIIALASTAFYWLPMLWYSDQIVKTTIFSDESELAFLLVSLALWIGFRWRRIRGIEGLSVAIALFCASVFGKWYWESSYRSIPFHFYRFKAIGIYLLVWSMIVFTREATLLKRGLRVGVPAFSALLLVFSMFHYGFQTYDFNRVEMKKSHILEEDFTAFQSLPSGSRIFTVGETRSVDFAVDSAIRIYNPHLELAKGLYWEANERNALLNSYLISLISTPGVLSSEFYNTDLCSELVCMWDQFFNDFQITHITTRPKETLPFWIKNKRNCFFEYLDKNAKKRSEFNFNRSTHLLYELKPATQTTLLEYRPLTEKRSNDYFSGVAGYCTAKSDLKKEILYRVKPNKLSHSEYRFNLPFSVPVRFSLPYNWVPGMKLIDADQNEIAFDTQFPILTAHGRGPISLTIEKTPILVFAELLSAIVFSFCIAGFVWSQRKSFKRD